MAISTIQTTNKESDSNTCRWFPKRVTKTTPKHPLSVTIRGQSSGYSSRILLTNLRDSESHLLKCLPANFRNAGGSSEISNETSSMFSSATYRTLLSHTLKRKNKQHVSKSVRIPHKYIYIYIYDKQKIQPRTEHGRNFGVCQPVTDRSPSFASTAPQLRTRRPSQL